MPREIVLGNGKMLVNLDGAFSIRDLYYPYVGWANHVGGHRCRVGVWTDDAGFAWLEDEAWERRVAYKTDTLVTDCTAIHNGIGIRLEVSHAVLHNENIFAARYRLENLWDTAREARLFLAQDLRVDESDIGDTVFYSPYVRALVHYKRDRYFLFGGQGRYPDIKPSAEAFSEKEQRPRKSMEDVHIDELLEMVVDLGGTDLHLSQGFPPIVRVNGELKHLSYEDVTPLDMQQIMYGILTDEQIQKFERDWSLDFPYALHKRARFQVQMYRDKGFVAAAIRFLPPHTHPVRLQSRWLGPQQWACGDKGFKGAEGTWRDAEDGVLSMNAIAQGAVDSVAGYDIPLCARGAETIWTWIVAGETLDEVAAGQDMVVDSGSYYRRSSVKDHGHAICHAARPDLDVLPEKVAQLYKRSILTILTQCDKRGAIIASNDTDILETARAHYSYLWPRDGALVSLALDSAGQRQTSRAFFEFCARVLPTDRAALMHKYSPDGTIGASWHPWVVDGIPEIPFQEDGTALVLYALWKHVQTGAEENFAARMWERFARPAADFLTEFRHLETGLPLPSWDLWEERRGCHIWTVASVIAALRAASEYAAAQGHTPAAARYQTTAAETLAAFQVHFWDDEAQRYARMVSIARDGSLVRDMTVDSSAAALFLFDVLLLTDARLAATMHAIGRCLWVKTPVGGLARYEQDYYFRVSDDFAQVPGNPWVICTLWLADWYCATATSQAELRPALDLLEWTAQTAMETGMLAEQVHPFTSAPLSVAPLTWSHAQFVSSTSAYLDKWKHFA